MINLEKYCKNKASLDKLLVSMALTFRTNLKTLSSILGKDENEILSDFLRASVDSYGKRSRSLEYLFYHDYADQEVAKNKFEAYANKLSQVLGKEYEDKRKGALVKKVILSEIDDSIVKSRFKDKPKKEYSEEDILALINYQLKYSVTQAVITETFGISRSRYSELVLSVSKKYPEIYDRYIALASYNESLKYSKHNEIVRNSR